MTELKATYIDELYAVFFGRTPSRKERDHWVDVLSQGISEREAFRLFRSSREYELRTRIKPAFPPGHYYSPVLDPAEAYRYLSVDRAIDPATLRGLDISMPAMLATWERLRPILAAGNIPWLKNERCRYYADNPIFPIGDAAILRAIILNARPRRIVEIGSGFSSACMLDALDEADAADTKVTFIEPYPTRLFGLLRDSDRARCEIIEKPVQAVDPGRFTVLVENDILFIDSTHVMKTGSDVNFELFEILPRLKPGVLVHFHDIHYPFEYPEAWVMERLYSWNEIYALRAFLMYNSAFRIEFFNSLFATQHAELVKATCPDILKNPGGSLWLRKTN